MTGVKQLLFAEKIKITRATVGMLMDAPDLDSDHKAVLLGAWHNLCDVEEELLSVCPKSRKLSQEV